MAYKERGASLKSRGFPMGPWYGLLASFRGSEVWAIVLKAVCDGVIDSELGAHTRGSRDLLWIKGIVAPHPESLYGKLEPSPWHSRHAHQLEELCRLFTKQGSENHSPSRMNHLDHRFQGPSLDRSARASPLSFVLERS